MFDAKPASVPLAADFMLSQDLCPKSETELDVMKRIPYTNAIGSVMYLMVSTRPYIAYTVSCLNRYMSNHSPVHWETLKWLLRYLKQTAKYGLCYSKCDDGVLLTGIVDSNYANDKDKRNWKSQLQHIVALSTTESEYIAITEAMEEAVWLQRVLSELKFVKTSPVVFSDSQSAIQLCKNPVFHDRTKHIDVRIGCMSRGRGGEEDLSLLINCGKGDKWRHEVLLD
ncbi:secreted RxLR effector protein 161-like [Salvia hispanica]|uniref:secreted RxLR effector protein 161-like n=1 Tax=Salvia hispanica TaxID=49212 RepID=UPI00200913EA|nr:secreted RxLR effector protein 161-like [Salvia hispanica]